MTPLEILIACVLFWLYMTRVGIRWLIELDGESFDTGLIFFSLGLWWLLVPMLLPNRLQKAGWKMGGRTRRILIGESRWHKRERLAEEHKARSQELGVPES